MAPTAAQFGVIGPAELAYYNSLPVAPDADSLPNDKDDFVESILDTVLNGVGYDPLGLDNNLAVAEGKINATLLEGAYFASHNFGWSDFNIDGTTGTLKVTTWGVPDHSPADLANDLDAILALEPAVIGEFEVTPTTGSIIGTDGKDCLVGTGGDDVILGAGGRNKLQGGNGNDYLDAGKSNDQILGNDEIFGRVGSDQLHGNGGDDRIVGGEGREQMFGGAGNDIFEFAPGFGRDRIEDFDASPAGGTTLSISRRSISLLKISPRG